MVALLLLTIGVVAIAKTGILDPPLFGGRLEIPAGNAVVLVEEAEPLPGVRVIVTHIPRRAGIRLRAVLLADAGKLGSLAAKGAGLGALVGVNGDYHQLDGQHKNHPQALLVDQGQVLAPGSAAPYEASFWIDRSGVPHIGAVDSTTNAWLALGSGPRLLSGGSLTPGLADVELPGYVNALARTAIGFSDDTLILVTTLQIPRAGLSHANMARTLLALGCREGLALDGGPSTTLWARTDWRGGALINLPPGSGGAEPELASGLFALPPRTGTPGLE